MATKLVLQCESALVKWGFDAHKIFSTITYLVLGEKFTIFQLLITVLHHSVILSAYSRQSSNMWLV